MQDIKTKRSQSLLLELLKEALALLADPRLNSLSITEVILSKGKHNAQVYVLLDGDESEQRAILAHLKKAEGILKEYILSASGWYRCPSLSFKPDDSLNQANRLDQIFSQIKKESP